MLIVRPNADGTFQELPPVDLIVGEGTDALTIPFENFSVWYAAGTRQIHGLYLVGTPQAPAGKTRVSYTLAFNADQSEVEYHPVFEDIPVPVPYSVSRRQMLLALYRTERLDEVEAIVAAGDKIVQISWNETPSFDRDNALLCQMAADKGWTDSELDALFTLAATL